MLYYMGRITYTFNAQGNDSVVVGVAITNQTTGMPLSCRK